jgi:hypothetical protein
LHIGEARGQMTAALTLEANDEDVAKLMTSIGSGLVALLKLQASDKPDSLKLAQAITLKQDGAGLVATLSVPAGDIVQMMKDSAEKKAEKKTKTQN